MRIHNYISNPSGFGLGLLGVKVESPVRGDIFLENRDQNKTGQTAGINRRESLPLTGMIRTLNQGRKIPDQTLTGLSPKEGPGTDHVRFWPGKITPT